MRKNCKTFKEWIQSQVDEFFATHHGQGHGHHLYANIWRTTLGGSVGCMIVNRKRNRTGFASVSAKAHDDPTKIAIGLAWADYKGEKIPEFTVPLWKLSTLDKFIYRNREYTYIVTNPCSPNNIIVQPENGCLYQIDRKTRVRVLEDK